MTDFCVAEKRIAVAMTLLTRSRFPLSRPVIAVVCNLSARQTQRLLRELIAAGVVCREFRSGEGRRNPVYSLLANTLPAASRRASP